MQIEVIRVKGHWIAGGNIAFPFLMAMLLWYVPRRAKEFTGPINRGVILKEKDGIQRNRLCQ